MIGRRRTLTQEGEVQADARRPPAPAVRSDAILALQRSAGNRATADMLRGRAPRATVQRRWVIMDWTKYFWEDDGGERDYGELPSDFQSATELTAPAGGTYQVDEGRSRRIPLYFSVEGWVRSHPHGSGKKAGDVFNPFGRFATSAVASFMASPEMSKEAAAATLAALAEKDSTYKPILKVEAPTHPSGYPLQVRVENDQLLELVETGPFGAVYAASVPTSNTASYDPSRAKDPKELKLVGAAPGPKMEWSYKLTPFVLESWSGRKRAIQQHEVMGGSAGDAAENAGFARNEGQGWEWLHMIAHSMGGISVLGPQVSQNLVAGTSEANSQMIVVEEWIKDAITRSGGYATLWVGVDMFDTERHIGRRIAYDVEIYNTDEDATAVYHFEFDPLSRRQPLTIKNRSDRYSAREAHPKGGATGATSHQPRSEPTAHQPYVPADADPRNKLMDTAIEIMRTGSIERFHGFLEEAKASGQGIPTDVFSEVGEFLPQDQVLPYLQQLRRTSFNDDRAIQWVVYGHLLGKGNPERAWMLGNVLGPLYQPAPVPEKLRKQCQPI